MEHNKKNDGEWWGRSMTKVFVFVAALAAGTVCSLSSKVLMSMQSTGMTGQTETFSYPLFQTFGMFLGSVIVFVALMKQLVLKDTLKTYQWVGIVLNCLSIVLVGFSAMMVESMESAQGNTAGGGALLGVSLILLGSLLQSLQYVFEEKVMSHKDHDPTTPPLLLIVMEGLWGLLICVFLLYPLAYYYPGKDHGSFESPYNTYKMIANSPSIQIIFLVYFVACLVTYMLDSVWHAILDNFRPATVWGADMMIFYCVTAAFGEPWNQPWSWVQLLGMCVLLYGTAIYNAPNPGSIQLTGTASSCFIDCSSEYASPVPVRRVPPATFMGPHVHLGDVVLAVHPYPYYYSLSRFLTRAAHHWNKKTHIRRQEREATAGVPSDVHHHSEAEGEESCVLLHNHRQHSATRESGTPSLNYNAYKSFNDS